ncbi:MAG: tetratricopeptide repeat protein [Erysipelotrichaceae bacterium]|nr:tetratricopeptide repeat protein [Erysipelotrichaceae bacterium]
MNEKLKYRLISLFLAVCALFLLVRYAVNERFISAYHNGDYSGSGEKSLLVMNVPQSWLPHYNLGNAAYQRESYDEAISEYAEALTLNPSHPDECRIRINMALAMLKKIDFEHLETENDVETAVSRLLNARAVLTEENCAGESDDNGHSETAEELKKNIDDMLKQLGAEGNEDSEEEGEEGDQPEQSQENNETSQREQEIREQLDEMMKDSMEEKNDIQEQWYNENSSGSQSSQYHGKTW